MPGTAPTRPARAHTVTRPPPSRYPGRVPYAEVTSRLLGSSPFELSPRRPVGTRLGGRHPGWARFLWEAVPRAHRWSQVAASAREGRTHSSPPSRPGGPLPLELVSVELMCSSATWLTVLSCSFLLFCLFVCLLLPIPVLT